MTLPSVTALPLKRGNSDTEPRVPVDTEAEFGEMLLQAQECQGLPVSPQKLGERLEQTSRCDEQPRAKRGAQRKRGD